MMKNELIRELLKGGYLRNPLILETFEKIDRKDFVPAELESSAYLNEPLPIGFGQTISQPLTVAFMLELLDPHPGEQILEVGAGSGWVSALLAYCVEDEGKKSGHVVAIERIRELKDMAERHISKYSFLGRGIVEIILGDGSRGAPPEHCPPGGFDKIISAASAKEIPEVWKKQVKVRGRIVAPVWQSILVLDKISPTECREREYFGFSFVPLVSDSDKNR